MFFQQTIKFFFKRLKERERERERMVEKISISIVVLVSLFFVLFDSIIHKVTKTKKHMATADDVPCVLLMLRTIGRASTTRDDDSNKQAKRKLNNKDLIVFPSNFVTGRNILSGYISRVCLFFLLYILKSIIIILLFENDDDNNNMRLGRYCRSRSRCCFSP
jgi:uncharacterized membrane protein